MKKSFPLYCKRDWPAVVVIVLSMVPACWLVTQGSGSIFELEPLSSFYDGQADAIREGHLDVQYSTIAGEAFVVNGKF